MNTPEQLNSVLDKIGAEVARAQKLFPMDDVPQRALPHYYYGVIQEEMKEVSDEIFAFNPGKNRDTRPAMRAELIQLAAMAVRAYLEI